MEKTKTIQDITIARECIYRKKLFNPYLTLHLQDEALFQEHWYRYLNTLKEEKKRGENSFGSYTIHYKNCNFDGNSFLGLTTIAIRSRSNINEGHIKTQERKRKLLINPIRVPFEEIKEHTQELLALGFKPTPQDKDFAILEAWERCASSIIQKQMLLQYYLLLSGLMVPQEIISSIILPMFKSELLF